MRLVIFIAALCLVFGIAMQGACSSQPSVRQEDARSQVIEAQARATEIANERQVRLNEIEISRKATAVARQIERDDAAERALTYVAVTLGIVSVPTIIIVACAAAYYIVVLSQAKAHNVREKARFVAFAADPLTMAPPPYLIEGKQFLDTATKERGNLDEGRDIDRLSAALAAQNRNTAILARAVERIAARTKDGQVAASLPGVAQAMPLLETDLGGETHE